MIKVAEFVEKLRFVEGCSDPDCHSILDYDLVFLAKLRLL